ncbi:hypothetical protein RhiXN_05365 [Rhizoctonia solani]|uniref:Uncharacterized protein n=1 Tax=Rhizoctonia solani TaxID=456999 RepID=A0A8H8NS61_9AGAM|nr:uncharacterized protein RhiXN_05365 [Rhizoctonia solani]QRW17363.1 hypothetical protein RhiXN_05365 [Rhizoctonia solani]
MNAIIPGASHGKLYWTQITSSEQAAVHAEVLELNPYLRRFPGGWITEVLMQRQLRNSRETRSRNRNKSQGKQRAPKAAATANNPSTCRGSDGATTQEGSQKRKGPPPQQTGGASGHSEPKKSKRTSDAPAPDVPAPPNKKPRTLLGYFQPVIPQSSAATHGQKRQGGEISGKDHEAPHVPSSESSSEEDDWGDAVAREMQELKSRTRGKEGSAPGPNSSISKTSGSRIRPKVRPPPSDDGNDTEGSDFFRRNTRVTKQELIDKAEGVEEGASKPKPAPKGKKPRGRPRKQQ